MLTKRLVYIISSFLLCLFSIGFFLTLIPSYAASDSTCNVPSNSYSTIQIAINDPVCHVISLSNGTFTETLKISRTVTIQGQSAADTIMSGASTNRVLEISPGVGVTLTDLTVANGWAKIGGGILNNESNLFINHCTISDNRAHLMFSCPASSGGGIYNNKGTVIINRSSIRNNSANGGGLGDYCDVPAEGGGIHNHQGTMTITQSTISENGAAGSPGYGGGIDNYGGSLVIINSTLSNNLSFFGRGGGGIINRGGMITIAFSSLVDNQSAGSFGDNILNEGISKTVTLVNSIVANSVSSSNCEGSIYSQGYNLESGDTCNFNAPGDITDTNPLIWLLQDNGGDSFTHGLLSGSPAVDHIPFGINGCGIDIDTDQRGEIRSKGTGCDIGAFEGTLSFYSYLPIAVQ